MIWYFGWDEAILAGRFHVDLAKLPAVADVSPARKPMLIKLALALLWLVGSYILWLPFFDAPRLVQAIALLVPLSSLVLVAMAVRSLLRRRYICFDKEHVDVREKRWWRNSEWSAPYTAFLGIRLRKQIIPMGLENRTVYVAELAHANPKLSLPLLVSSDGPPSRKVLSGAARIFGIPLLVDDVPTRMQQQIERFNRPISEIAKSYDLASIYNPLEPIPRNISITTLTKADEPTYEVALLPHRLRPLWIMILVSTTLFAVGVALVTRNIAIIVDSLAFAGFALFVLVASLQYARKLRLTRRELICEASWWTPKAPRSVRIPLDQIDSIRINRSSSGQSHHIEIRYGKERLELGASLPTVTLDWLRRFLISAVMTA